MRLPFVNREREFKDLDTAERRGGLLVVYGRRRVGKTRLLRQWLESRSGLYSQAIEAHRDQQVEQVFLDLQPCLETQLTPKSWPELFEILALQRERWVLCLDEFPYLTAVDRSLPSQLQKWVDHGMPDGCLLILAGSSTRTMHDLFLNRTAPLYGRAQKLLRVEPMEYGAFCEACAFDPGEIASFEKFACVGGIPRYWEFVEAGQDAVGLADALYFDLASYMEQEPQRILRDEIVVAEVKWRQLSSGERAAVRRDLEARWERSSLEARYRRVRFDVLDASLLRLP
jgi:predicted AAA+ superfamily ATPase